MKPHQGIALILVVGVLGVLSVLAVAFVTMAQLERKASSQRVNAARAYLLAKSGIEDAMARLALGQDPAYGGENWDGSADGLLSTFEATNEVYHVTGAGTPADINTCPLRHAMRPSLFVHSGTNPATVSVDGKLRGYSGLLKGDLAPLGNTYALKVADLNALICINGGTLDASVRADPDGSGAAASDFPLNPNAAAEVAPILSNGIKNHNDASMEGPNGFLVRLLDNLDAVVTNNATSDLGVQVVSNRPVGGYTSVDQLEPLLGQTRYDQFRNYLTVTAWADPTVMKPQPMDGRPHRFEDIDDAHRVGTPPTTIAGVGTDATRVSFTGYPSYPVSAISGIQLTLNPGLAGSGTEANPWVQTISTTNYAEGFSTHAAITYPVTWERSFVYAWSQLRPAPAQAEPRPPISINTASSEILAAVFLGLKGTALEVWDGNGGWDAGFGWFSMKGATPAGTYPYPNPATEDTPWHRTRVDYGMSYGLPGRPWYGPATYNPHAPPTVNGGGGKPVIQAAPLGRLQVTRPITLDQASALAAQVRQRVTQAGPFRTWIDFNIFIDALPSWEDVSWEGSSEDGLLDGTPYTVNGDGNGGAPYTRRIYRREDWDSDGMMTRQTFTAASGNWATAVTWKDVASDPTGVPGLTHYQKDVIKAMANPNADLNVFNPDANLWKEVDKAGVAGLLDGSAGYVHTTEFCLDSPGFYALRALGRVRDCNGHLQASRQMSALAKTAEIFRDTTQADFLKDAKAGTRTLAQHFAVGTAPLYTLSGALPLVSLPEPQSLALADYDGQVSLGFIAPAAGPGDTLLGDLFDTVDAGGVAADPDLRGPSRLPLLAPAGQATGNVFPDGVYSEKDRSLKYPYGTRLPTTGTSAFYLAFWVKPNWFPEASPRPHCLMSFSPDQGVTSLSDFGFAYGVTNWDLGSPFIPTDDIGIEHAGLYFVPARNNFWQDASGAYGHNVGTTRGFGWPRRTLIWGTVHAFFSADTVNRRGIEAAPMVKPVGRLEAHRWQHVACQKAPTSGGNAGVTLVLGNTLASANPGWQKGFGTVQVPLRSTHASDGSTNHIRFGEIAGLQNMNYVADATFAHVQIGNTNAGTFFTGASSPAVTGRYHKETGAAFISSKLPPGIRPLRATWTEIPCDLWFDGNNDGTGSDGWLGDAANGYVPRNDQFKAGGASGANGLRDVRIDLEIWDDVGTTTTADDIRLAAYNNPGSANPMPSPRTAVSRLYYKAIFENEWNDATRANNPLDVTPYLDDVTVTYMPPSGPRILAWSDGEK